MSSRPRTTYVFLCLILSSCFSPTKAISAGTEGATDTTDNDAGRPTTSAPNTSTLLTSVGSEDSSSGTNGTSPVEEVCGDGTLQGREVCDDGTNDGAYNGCMPDCADFGPACGDSIINGPEDCDDADDINGNGCNNDCGVSAAVLWTVQGGPLDVCGAQARDVDVDTQDEIYVTGFANCPPEPLAAWLAKYQADGNALWVRTWGTGQAASLGVVVAKSTIVAVGADGANAFTRSYNPVGDLIDGFFYESGGQPTAFTGVDTHVSGFILAGGLQQSGSPGLIHSVDWNGTEVWTELGNPAEGGWYSLAISEDGDSFAVAGWSAQGGQDDALVSLYSVNGTQIWNRVIAGSAGAGDRAYDVAFDPMGDIVASGQSRDPADQFWVRKYSPDGASLWTHTTKGEGPGSDSVAKLAIDSAGAVVVAGSFQADKLGQASNIWVRKLNPSGNEMWTATHNGDADEGDWAAGIAIDTNDNIIVVGGVRDGVTVAGEFWMRKYAP